MIKAAVKGLLRETFNGVAADAACWYIDAGPGGSMIDAIGDLSAEAASTPPREGGKTIAGHVAHAAYHLEVLSAFLLGEKQQINWKESWNVTTVNESQWKKLRTDLYTAYVRFERVVERIHWKDVTLGAAIGAVAHAAYHFGAIRQMALIVKAGGAASPAMQHEITE